MLRDASSLDLRALDAAIPPTPGATLLLSGSLATGLAHGRSDVDVHVLGGDARPLDVEVRVEDARVQLTRVPDGACDLARSLAIDGIEATAWSHAFFLSDKERWELQRLVEAVPIRRSPAHDWVASDALRRAVRRIVMGTAAHRIARAGDDVRGLLAVDEPDVARDVVRQMLRDVATLVLAALDDLAASERMLLPRLRRSGLATSEAAWLVDAYERGDGDLGLLPRIQGIAALAQLLAWDEAISPDACTPSRRQGRRRWRRSPHLWLVRRPDAVTLADAGGHGYRLPPDLARLWLLVETGDAEAIGAALARTGAPLSRGPLESGIARLLDLELIEPERR